MKHTLYTVFEQLISNNDKELSQIIEQYAKRPVQRNQLGGSNSNYTCMITIGDMVSHTSATDIITDILTSIRNNEDDSLKGFLEIEKKMHKEGIYKMIQYLLSKIEEEDAAIAEQFVTPIQHLDSLFKGRPLYKIIVEDEIEEKKDYDKTEGRYHVKLYNCRTNVSEDIPFATKDPKVLFLWFLMNNRQRFSAIDLRRGFQQMAKIANAGFHGSDYIDNLFDKLDYNQAKGTVNGLKFAEFLKIAKKDCNAYINKVLNGRDNKDWYIILNNCDEDDIANENIKENKYSISLTNEFIKLPNSLIEIKNNYPWQ